MRPISIYSNTFLNESYSIPEFNKLAHGDYHAQKFVKSYVDKGIATGSMDAGKYYIKLSKDDTKSEDFAKKIIRLNHSNQGVDVVYIKGNDLLAKIRCHFNSSDQTFISKKIWLNPHNLKGSEIYDEATGVFAISVNLPGKSEGKEYKQSERIKADKESRTKEPTKDAKLQVSTQDIKNTEEDRKKNSIIELTSVQKEKLSTNWKKASKSSRQDWLTNAGYKTVKIGLLSTKRDIDVVKKEDEESFYKMVPYVLRGENR